MGFALTIDKDVEIKIDATIKITSPSPPGQVILSTTYGGVKSTHFGVTHMAYTLPGDKKVQLQISYVDGNGNPAVVDGAVVWTSSDPNIADVETMPVTQGAEGSVVWLTPGAAIGNCQITAQADADLGAGVRHINTLLDVTVVGGEAVSGTIAPVGEQVPI